MGALLGFLIIGKGRYSHGYWLASDDIFPFILGAGLWVGFIASYYGDRLWLADRMFQNDPVEHSKNSFSLSVTIGSVGVGLMGCAVLRTLGWMGR